MAGCTGPVYATEVLVGPWTHQSQPQLCLGNSFLKRHKYINKKNPSPPSGVPVGMHWWSIWVLTSQHLIRSQRSHSPVWAIAPRTRMSRCTETREEWAKPSHRGGRRSLLVTPTKMMNRLAHTDNPMGACLCRQGAASSLGHQQGMNPVVCRYKPIIKPPCQWLPTSLWKTQCKHSSN